MKVGKSLLNSLMAFVCILAFSGQVKASQAKKRTIHVGVVLRLEDKYNNSVSEMMTGVEAAKALFEQKHPGTQIVIHRYPHTEDLSTVVAAADKVIKDKLSAVIGGELSEEAIVLRDKLGPAKIIFITPTSSSPTVTEGFPFSFRACFSDRLVAEQLASFTFNHLKPNAVGVIHNISSPYTDFLSKEFIANFKKEESKNSKIIPLFEEKVLGDSSDFSNQINVFIEHKITHLVMLTHQTDLLRFALQAANKGFFPVYIGSDGWGSNENIYKKFVTDSPFASKFEAFRNSYWKENSPTKMGLEFKNEYKRMFSHEPNAWSAIAFDTSWILFTAMNNAKDNSKGDSIREEMLKLKNTPLVTTQNFKFGTDNSPRKDLYIYEINKNGIHYSETLK